ncbi:hypothetical protein E2C01_008924 [Portunus trituberculatus]|nr:hypothetical protein [Portunus trituberculatus]
MDVPYVPGTILLLAGEFLHFHSYKRFKAPMHRVVVPSEHQPGKPHRCSLVRFEQPDLHQPMWPASEDPTIPAPLSVKDYYMPIANKAIGKESWE